jgi:predicted transcriptional regulator
MNLGTIICFRIDYELDRRIVNILGEKFRSRSQFLRYAIEKAVLQEEGQQRLRKAHSAIDWG